MHTAHQLGCVLEAAPSLGRALGVLDVAGLLDLGGVVVNVDPVELGAQHGQRAGHRGGQEEGAGHHVENPVGATALTTALGSR